MGPVDLRRGSRLRHAQVPFCCETKKTVSAVLLLIVSLSLSGVSYSKQTQPGTYAASDALFAKVDANVESFKLSEDVAFML